MAKPSIVISAAGKVSGRKEDTPSFRHPVTPVK